MGLFSARVESESDPFYFGGVLYRRYGRVEDERSEGLTMTSPVSGV